jgi:hypothetical protein
MGMSDKTEITAIANESRRFMRAELIGEPWPCSTVYLNLSIAKSQGHRRIIALTSEYIGFPILEIVRAIPYADSNTAWLSASTASLPTSDSTIPSDG